MTPTSWPSKRAPVQDADGQVVCLPPSPRESELIDVGSPPATHHRPSVIMPGPGRLSQRATPPASWSVPGRLRSHQRRHQMLRLPHRRSDVNRTRRHPPIPITSASAEMMIRATLSTATMIPRVLRDMAISLLPHSNLENYLVESSLASSDPARSLASVGRAAQRRPLAMLITGIARRR